MTAPHNQKRLANPRAAHMPLRSYYTMPRTPAGINRQAASKADTTLIRRLMLFLYYA